MIPEDEWVWCGYAGHFIGAPNCRMHLHTRVGDWRISTVGDYRPPGSTESETIGAGADSFFETFVFPVSGKGKHGEGEVTNWTEVEGRRYATTEEAEVGHMEMCRSYAQR